MATEDGRIVKGGSVGFEGREGGTGRKEAVSEIDGVNQAADGLPFDDVSLSILACRPYDWR